MDDELPQTDKVFDAPTLNTSEHEWLQQGYYIMDNCPIKKLTCHPGGIAIPYDKMLSKNANGEYELINESR